MSHVLNRVEVRRPRWHSSTKTSLECNPPPPPPRGQVICPYFFLTAFWYRYVLLAVENDVTIALNMFF